jgi:hypothetical protein
MVISFNPSDFLSWSKDRKIDRYRRILKWHERNRQLGPATVPYSWGTYQILSQVGPSPVVNVLVAVYDVPNLVEFDKLMLEDPMRDITRYATILLEDLAGDFDTDKKRFDDLMGRLTAGRPASDLSEIARVRARYSSAPDFVGKYQFSRPSSPVRTYDISHVEALGFANQSLEVLIYGMNLEEDHGWDDLTKAIHYEKVLWWHDYVAKMISEDRISHVWGNHDFCDVEGPSYRSNSAVTIYKSADLEHFADVYRQDPLRNRARFWSIVLKPISLQEQHDKETLQRAEAE